MASRRKTVESYTLSAAGTEVTTKIMDDGTVALSFPPELGVRWAVNAVFSGDEGASIRTTKYTVEEK